MQEGSEKLTIAEFAARAGCTTQRVYQLLQNSLQPFAIVENGRKFILSDGLPVVLEARKKQGFTKGSPTLDNSCTNSCKELPTDETEQLRQELEKLTAKLRRTEADLTAAREQRDAADRKAAAADAERKRADAAEAQLGRIRELEARLDAARDDLLKAQTAAAAAEARCQAETKRADDLNAALQSAQASLQAEQMLHSQTQQRIGMHDDAGTDAEAVTVGDGQSTDASDQDGEQKKPGFFARLFGRK